VQQLDGTIRTLEDAIAAAQHILKTP
jgi:hypothetical protein